VTEVYSACQFGRGERIKDWSWTAYAARAAGRRGGSRERLGHAPLGRRWRYNSPHPFVPEAVPRAMPPHRFAAAI